MRQIFISDKIGSERLPFLGEDSKLGQAHYSWKIISTLYQNGLRKSGYSISNIARPEIYKTDIAKNIIGQANDSIHLAVKPVEHLRPLTGAKNIFVCGWEFPEFNSNPNSENPFHNQVRILGTADSIVCWTDYTRDNLLAVGLKQASTLPPPIPTPALAIGTAFLDSTSISLADYRAKKEPRILKLGAALEDLRPSKLFITVLNPFDQRKQLTAMLKGFQNALRENKTLALIIKLVIDNIHTTVGNINEILAIHYNFHGSSERILFVGDNFPETDLASLVSSADFYLCTSSAEGLNIPLIEAQLLGVPPVSTWNTAMGTYLDRDCAIEIPSIRRAMKGQAHALYETLQVTHFPSDEHAIASGIIRASTIDRTAYDSLSKAAKANAHRRFGITLFGERFGKLITSLAPEGN